MVLFRVWWRGQELLSVQLVRQEPVELLAEAVAAHAAEETTAEEETEPEPLNWFSSDPEDTSHLIWHSPEETDR